MDSAVIAAALATIYGAVAPPAGESAIALATHELPDELKAAELPALLVWPPEEEPVMQSGMDRSRLTFPVILYLPRAARTTQARIRALYAWRDAVRVVIAATHSHLQLAGIAEADSRRVVVNDPGDTVYGVVDYDTVRVETFVKVYERRDWVP